MEKFEVSNPFFLCFLLLCAKGSERGRHRALFFTSILSLFTCTYCSVCLCCSVFFSTILSVFLCLLMLLSWHRKEERTTLSFIFVPVLIAFIHTYCSVSLLYCLFLSYRVVDFLSLLVLLSRHQFTHSLLSASLRDHLFFRYCFVDSSLLVFLHERQDIKVQKFTYPVFSFPPFHTSWLLFLPRCCSK